MQSRAVKVDKGIIITLRGMCLTPRDASTWWARFASQVECVSQCDQVALVASQTLESLFQPLYQTAPELKNHIALGKLCTYHFRKDKVMKPWTVIVETTACADHCLQARSKHRSVTLHFHTKSTLAPLTVHDYRCETH